MATIKIFQMNDCDWMAAASLEEAVAEYKKTYVGEDRDAEMIEDAAEVPDEQLDVLKFDRRGEDDLAEGEPTVITFREQLNRLIASGCEFPDFFASTEF